MTVITTAWMGANEGSHSHRPDVRRIGAVIGWMNAADHYEAKAKRAGRIR